MRIVSLEEMKSLESNTFIKNGISETLIIENVGLRVSNKIKEHINTDQSVSKVIFLIGRGNNGADGLAIARQLQNSGFEVECLIFGFGDTFSKELDIQINISRQYKVKITEFLSISDVSSYFKKISNYSSNLAVDCIMGTGFSLPLSDNLYETFKIINKLNWSSIISVDIPSGVNGNYGIVDREAINADFTVAISFPKIGHFTAEGPINTGKLSIVDAGFPKHLLKIAEDKFLLDESYINKKLLRRDILGYKNTFGHLLVIGGSPGMTGASVLTGKSGFAAGAGLVTIKTWEENYFELISNCPNEIMKAKININDDFNYEKYKAAVIGPGLGISENTKKVVHKFVSNFKGAVVLDADAINCLSESDFKVLKERDFPIVITPHVGEFARFVNKKPFEILKDPITYVRKISIELGLYVVLKSSYSYIGVPNGNVYILARPNDGLATAGSGDVLAGVIGGMLAQSELHNDNDIRDNFLTSILIHSNAGKLACEKFGNHSMNSSDIIDEIPNVLKNL